jgi:hypothetical protein
MKNIKLFEDFVNEGDMTKDYDGFIVQDRGIRKDYKFRYIKGTNNKKVEDEAIAKLMKKTGAGRHEFMVNGFVRKGEWDKSDAEVLESVNEAKEIDNAYTFDNLEDYRKAVKALRDAGFYRSGNGYPPKGDEPGTYVEDERWLDLRINGGEKEAAKLIKKTKTKYSSEYKGPRGYTIHNHGGYLD